MITKNFCLFYPQFPGLNLDFNYFTEAILFGRFMIGFSMKLFEDIVFDLILLYN